MRPEGTPSVTVAALALLALCLCGLLIAWAVMGQETPVAGERTAVVPPPPSGGDGSNGGGIRRTGPAPGSNTADAPVPLSPVVHEGTKEAALMDQLHRLRFTQPSVSLQLAREGNRLYPDSPAAAERDWYAIRCLVELGRFDEAIEESRLLVERHPDTFFAGDVTRHLLSHPMN